MEASQKRSMSSTESNLDISIPSPPCFATIKLQVSLFLLSEREGNLQPPLATQKDKGRKDCPL